MKKIIAILLSLALVLTVAYGQFQRKKVRVGTATTAWQTLTSPQGSRLSNPNFSNDATSGADTLWCSTDGDTLVTSNCVPLLKGEVVQFPTSSNILRVKTSAGTIPYRMWGFY